MFDNFTKAIKSQLVYFENLYVIDSSKANIDHLLEGTDSIEKEYNNFLIKKLGLSDSSELDAGIEEVMEAREAWCTGTAAVITPVGSVTYKGRKHSFDTSSPLSRKIYDNFQAIMNGTIPDKHGWLVNPWAPGQKQ